MTEGNKTKQPDKVHEAVWDFVHLGEQQSALIFLEDWFLLAIQSYEYDDEVSRANAVENYKTLKRLVTNLSVLEPQDVTPLTLVV